MAAFKKISEQIEASNPQKNIWVTANAGTGKTSVLTNRFIRLLLSGALPEKILCITYTKAGASEMKEKIIRTMNDLSLKPKEQAKAELERIIDAPPTDKQLELIRTVYLKIIDRPDKIKILTIHSLCQSILKKFPLEAGVQPYFTVIDDITKAELMNDATSRIFSLKLNDLSRLSSYKDDIGLSVQYLARNYSRKTVDKAINSIISKRYRFLSILNNFESIFSYISHLKTKLGADFDLNTLNAETYSSLSDLSRTLCPQLQGGKSDCQKILSAFDAYHASKDISDITKGFFTSDSVTPSTFRESILKNPGQINDLAKKAQAIILEHKNRLLNLNLFKVTEAITYTSYAIITAYDFLKEKRSGLDYEDLIQKTVELLNNKAASSWVLYKLDGGFEHLMLDEAQDTSPEQWQIINALSSEFYSGDSSSERARSFFVVGDEKQSIFRFQGADIENFYGQKKNYKQNFSTNQQPLSEVLFTKSFRNLPAILNLVDKIFEASHLKSAITDSLIAVTHHSERPDSKLFGLVKLNAPIPYIKNQAEDFHWHLPQEYPESVEQKSRIRLAKKIAYDISEWLNSGKMIPDQGGSRPLKPSDIMVLVRARDDLFRQLPTELLEYGISTSVSEKIDLANHIITEDLLSFAKFLVLPKDDYNLACLLKSPFFNLTDKQLYHLSYDRGEHSLFQNLFSNRQKYSHIVETLEYFLDKVDFLNPYEIFIEALDIKNIRNNFYKRFSTEFKNIIDEFLNYAQNFSKQYDSGMQGFIHWFSQAAPEIKSSETKAENEVRLMTVHGSKGLEAPIVIIADAKKAKNATSKEPVIYFENYFITPLLKDVRNAQAEAAYEYIDNTEDAESSRLLYVALTRPRDELHIYAADTREDNSEKPNNTSWYYQIKTALESLEGSNSKDDALIYTSPEYNFSTENVPSNIMASEPVFDEYKYLHAPIANQNFFHSSAVFSPSNLPSEQLEVTIKPSTKKLDIEEHKTKLTPELERGNIIHKIFEILPKIPEDKWNLAAEKIFAASQLKEQLSFDEIYNEAYRTLKNPEFSNIFFGSTFSEVPIMGIHENMVISGQIDRIIFSGNEITIVDFKTNRRAAESTSSTFKKYLNQLTIYRSLIQKIYPDHIIKTALLWSNESKLEYI